MNCRQVLLFLFLAICTTLTAQPVRWKNVKVLVYTKNGKG